MLENVCGSTVEYIYRTQKSVLLNAFKSITVILNLYHRLRSLMAWFLDEFSFLKPCCSRNLIQDVDYTKFRTTYSIILRIAVGWRLLNSEVSTRFEKKYEFFFDKTSLLINQAIK